MPNYRSNNGLRRRSPAPSGPKGHYRRLKELVASVSVPEDSPARLREVRTVAVLERVGSAEAREVLERLAAGEPSASLTREAHSALERLRRITPKP